MASGKNSTLAAELVARACKDLNEIQSQVPGDIKALREKIKKDATLNFKTDDAFLLKFLRARKFDQDRTLQLLRHYYRRRVINPALFQSSRSDMERILKAQIQGFLPQRTSDGKAIFTFKMNQWNPEEVSIEEMIFQMLMCVETITECEAIQVNGAVAIIDVKGINSTHVAHFTPSKAKELANVVVNCTPYRLKQLHFLNETPMFDKIWVFLKQFFSHKMRNRVVFHGDCLASLHEYVEPEILPEDFGGDLGPVDYTEWNEKVLSRFLSFSDELKYGFVKS